MDFRVNPVGFVPDHKLSIPTKGRGGIFGYVM